MFLLAGRVRSVQPAGPYKITSRFPYLLVYLCIRTYTCAIITSRKLLPCDLASLDFRRLLFVATMSSLAQLRF